MDVVFIAYIMMVMVMLLRLRLRLLLLLLAILVIRVTAHRWLMPRWSVVSILWVEMLQRLSNPGHIRISEDFGGRRLWRRATLAIEWNHRVLGGSTET